MQLQKLRCLVRIWPDISNSGAEQLSQLSEGMQATATLLTFEGVSQAQRLDNTDVVIQNGHVKVNVTEFKAKCLSIIDQVARGDEVQITKRGRVVARLIPDADVQAKPWMALRGTQAVWTGDPFAPAVDPADIAAERE